MLEYSFDKEKAVLHVTPKTSLNKEDFNDLSKVVDPFIEKTGGLNGLILQVERFPGWENWSALVRHFRFVRDHHRKIQKVAIVTNSLIGEIGEHITSHFVSAKIKHFSGNQIEAAKEWITKPSKK